MRDVNTTNLQLALCQGTTDRRVGSTCIHESFLTLKVGNELESQRDMTVSPVFCTTCADHVVAYRSTDFSRVETEDTLRRGVFVGAHGSALFN